jgi:hemolysin III
MNILKTEKISAYTHGAAVPVMAIGTIVLIVLSKGDFTMQAVSLIYGLSAIFLFTASFLYHSKKRRENEVSVWRKLDHTAIFFLIAGTYTPICYIYLDGTMKWGMIIAQWSLVFAGTIFKLFFINAPRIIGTLIYLLMGWSAVIPLSTLIHTMPGSTLAFLAAGGISYTAGAIIYAMKKPNPIPHYFGFHEIFHVFIIGGAVLHLIMVINGIGGYVAL